MQLISCKIIAWTKKNVVAVYFKGILAILPYETDAAFVWGQALWDILVSDKDSPAAKEHHSLSPAVQMLATRYYS